MSKYCPQCGSLNEDAAKFCQQCGASQPELAHQAAGGVSASGQPVVPIQSGAGAQSAGTFHCEGTVAVPGSVSAEPHMTESQEAWLNDAYAYVVGSTSAQYYVPRFKKMNDTSKKRSWNWCAFLFGPYWMAYRKMYSYAALLFVGPFIFYSILEFIGYMFAGESGIMAMDGFTSVIALILYLVIGMYGNWLYKHRNDAVIAEYQKTSNQERFMSQSETSFMAPLVLMACVFLVAFLPFVLMGLFV